VQRLVGDLSGGDPEPEALLARTHTTLAEIADVARRHDDPLLVCPMAETQHAAVDSLTVGERYLRRRLATDGGAATADLVLLVEAQELRLSIGELRVRRRASVAAELHRSLTRLRAGLDTTALLREVPRELGRLGYSRALMSGVRGTTWRATSAFAHQDESLAVALVQVGSSMPGRIGRPGRRLHPDQGRPRGAPGAAGHRGGRCGAGRRRAGLRRVPADQRPVQGGVHPLADGDTAAFARPMSHSYHDVWMELHEDLLLTLGRERDAADGH
jgi:hypothetical protein